MYHIKGKHSRLYQCGILNCNCSLGEQWRRVSAGTQVLLSVKTSYEITSGPSLPTSDFSRDSSCRGDVIVFPRRQRGMGSTVTEQHVTHILVVDDDRSIRETLRVVLQEEGYTVSEAEDGQVALKILQASKEPMVVLLDLRMPVLDGAGVLAFVADDQRLSALHAFLLITANRDAIGDKTERLLH